MSDCDQLGIRPADRFGSQCDGLFSLGVDGSSPSPLWTRSAVWLIKPPWLDANSAADVFASSEWASENRQVATLLRRDGSVVSSLPASEDFTFDSDPAFSPDGSSLVFARRIERTLYEQENGAPAALTIAALDGTLRTLTGLSPAAIT